MQPPTTYVWNNTQYRIQSNLKLWIHWMCLWCFLWNATWHEFHYNIESPLTDWLGDPTWKLLLFWNWATRELKYTNSAHESGMYFPCCDLGNSSFNIQHSNQEMISIQNPAEWKAIAISDTREGTRKGRTSLGSCLMMSGIKISSVHGMKADYRGFGGGWKICLLFTWQKMT